MPMYGLCRQKGRQAQDALLQRVNQETLRSLTERQEGAGPAGPTGRKVSEVVSYRSHADVPLVRDYIIQVCTADVLCSQLDACLQWPALRGVVVLHRSSAATPTAPSPAQAQALAQA